jgi:hypothetical protein
MKRPRATSCVDSGRCDRALLCAAFLFSFFAISYGGVPQSLHPSAVGQVKLVPGRFGGNEEVIRAEGFVKRAGNRLEVSRSTDLLGPSVLAVMSVQETLYYKDNCTCMVINRLLHAFIRFPCDVVPQKMGRAGSSYLQVVYLCRFVNQ